MGGNITVDTGCTNCPIANYNGFRQICKMEDRPYNTNDIEVLSRYTINLRIRTFCGVAFKASTLNIDKYDYHHYQGFNLTQYEGYDNSTHLI